MIRNSTARQMLYDWHGGMSSPFYAAASSGLVADWQALGDETQRCYNYSSNTNKDREQLAKLLVWIRHQCGASTLWINHPADGRTYSALPWSRKNV